MQYRLKLSQLPMFKYINRKEAARLVKSFSIIRKDKNADLTSFNEPVKGLYIVLQGSAEVYTQNFRSLLTTLGPGSFFGEMSLIENLQASANIRTIDDENRLLFCDKEKFKKQLAKHPGIAEDFYRGTAEMLSARLRNTNSTIEKELEKTRQLISDLLKSSEISTKLDRTRDTVARTGESMFKTLSELLPVLRELEEQHPESSEFLQKSKSALEAVLLIDSQNFDIISQQIDQVFQYIENVERFVQEQEMIKIKGDRQIFDLTMRENDDEGSIVFFD